MKKITDDTLVKVKVPRHLYESIKSKMALKEAEDIAEKKEKEADEKEEKPKYAGTKMSKSAAMDKVGRSRTKTVKGDMAKAYQPVHSRIYKEEEHIQEDMSVQAIIDAVKTLSPSDVGMVLTALASVLGAKKLAGGIKKSGSDISGITGAQHG